MRSAATGWRTCFYLGAAVLRRATLEQAGVGLAEEGIGGQELIED